MVPRTESPRKGRLISVQTSFGEVCISPRRAERLAGFDSLELIWSLANILSSAVQGLGSRRGRTGGVVSARRGQKFSPLNGTAGIGKVGWSRFGGS